MPESFSAFATRHLDKVHCASQHHSRENSGEFYPFASEKTGSDHIPRHFYRTPPFEW